MERFQVATEASTATMVCDDTLPGGDDLPMQHVRNVILAGPYDEVQQFMPKPGGERRRVSTMDLCVVSSNATFFAAETLWETLKETKKNSVAMSYLGTAV